MSPLRTLPNETLGRIACLLDLGSQTAFARVCKYLSTIVLDVMYKDLDIVEDGDLVDARVALEKWPRLKVLHFQYRLNVDPYAVRPALPGRHIPTDDKVMDTMAWFIRQFPLKTLALGKCPGYQLLSVAAMHRAATLQTLIVNVTGGQELHVLQGVASLTNLVELDVYLTGEGDVFEPVQLVLSHLEHLAVRGMSDPSVIKSLLLTSTFPSLRKLTLGMCMIPNQGLQLLQGIAAMTDLEELDVDLVVDADMFAPFQLVLHRLKHLKLGGVLSRSLWRSIFTSTFPSLQTLHLMSWFHKNEENQAMCAFISRHSTDAPLEKLELHAEVTEGCVLNAKHVSVRSHTDYFTPAEVIHLLTTATEVLRIEVYRAHTYGLFAEVFMLEKLLEAQLSGKTAVKEVYLLSDSSVKMSRGWDDVALSLEDIGICIHIEGRVVEEVEYVPDDS